MCDYSLHLVASRRAKIDDRIATTTFSGSITIGFAAPSQPDVAVCLLPGTELSFDAPVEYDRTFWLFGNRACRTRPRVSGKSTWTIRTCTTMHWNFQTVKSCWSRDYESVSGQPCCSCRRPSAIMSQNLIVQSRNKRPRD
jgi:hypothetical protein